VIRRTRKKAHRRVHLRRLVIEIPSVQPHQVKAVSSGGGNQRFAQPSSRAMPLESWGHEKTLHLARPVVKIPVGARTAYLAFSNSEECLALGRTVYAGHRTQPILQALVTSNLVDQPGMICVAGDEPVPVLTNQGSESPVVVIRVRHHDRIRHVDSQSRAEPESLLQSGIAAANSGQRRRCHRGTTPNDDDLGGLFRWVALPVHTAIRVGAVGRRGTFGRWVRSIGRSRRRVVGLSSRRRF